MPEQAKILEAIAENLGLSAGDLDRHALLVDDLNLSAIELSDLLQNLSEKFEVHLNPEEVEGVRTVDDLIVLVEDSML